MASPKQAQVSSSTSNHDRAQTLTLLEREAKTQTLPRESPKATSEGVGVVVGAADGSHIRE